MLVRFTIEGGCIPIREQAREETFEHYLGMLGRFDPSAELRARTAIRDYLSHHTEFLRRLARVTQ